MNISLRYDLKKVDRRLSYLVYSSTSWVELYRTEMSRATRNYVFTPG